MSKKGKVLVAMSGGIDSTVTAVMLHEEGYEVIGITMKTWDYATSGGSKKETGCCSLDSINDARAIAVDLGFSHFIVDIRDEFGDYVIDNFVGEYMAGRTPNPCVLCNTHIKWEALLKRADAMDCEFIATGHYAQLNSANGRHYVSRGLDLNKDQSYVLWGISQACLSRTKFPMGKYHKPEIKQMARDMGYLDIANKPESFEICFVPDNDYRGFLKRRMPDLEAKVDGGQFVDIAGNKLGVHRGYPFYTVGQRKGLGVAFGKPMFVTEIIPETNTVVLGEEHELNRNGMWVGNLNMQKYEKVSDRTPALTKVRYKHDGESSILYQKDDRIKVEFMHEVSAIAPGQSAVFYEGDDLIGGGNIFSSFQIAADK
ncbi:MAG: tRNA 2-thiouridine(34) synthase MnmA [Bacteroidetes bacterium]|nr:tRNA 2-thiouridine(34) synthase MnmA [Bacteroidota bacterium]